MEESAPRNLWKATAAKPVPKRSSQRRGPRKGKAEVVVVGAGITGLHAALALHRAGRKVAILDAHEPGAGTTGASSAHLTWAHDQRYHEMVSKHGKETALGVAQALMEAIDEIEAEGVDCDFERVPGFLFPHEVEARAEIRKEADACVELDLPARFVPRSSLPFPTRECLEFPRQAQFHPIKYLNGLAERAEAAGISIHRGVRVRGIEEEKTGVTLETSTGEMAGLEAAVIATHFPWSILTEAEAIPYRSYLIAAEIRGWDGSGLFWDTADPYHYLRTVEADGRRLLLAGGEDHRTGFDTEAGAAHAALEAYCRERFEVVAVRHRWSAQLYEPVDGLPFIGAAPGKHRVFIGSGYSGNGLTFGVLAGRMLAGLACGQQHPLEKVLSPGRIVGPATSSSSIREGVRTGRRMIGDRFFHEGQSAMEALLPGAAGVFKVDGKLIAAHRDLSGKLTQRSAVCTHMGGIVEWNATERSWDCPIHGGRFDCQGCWLEGPPPRDLPAV